MKPLLSVITINHNNSNGIERTLRSVCNQQNREFEYIVVDGGSTDGSTAIIQKYASHLTAWVTEKDHGIYHAMNKGIAMANGTYLLFLNSGDEFNGSENLNQAMAALKGDDLVSCNILLISEKGETLKKYPEYPTFKYMLTDSLPHPATFIKKTLFDKTGGYDETFKICSDWAFFLIALCKLDATYRHVPVILTKFYLGGISSSAENRELHLYEREQILAKYFSRFQDLIQLWKEDNLLKSTIQSSRLIKIARKIGFLKALNYFDQSNNYSGK